MIGKVLGNRYRVLREIGSGGMAWVYLAEDNKENRLVAVKILYPQFGEDLSYIQRFNREAKLASTLTDPHIVRVLDYGADRDIHYLVMEYIEGQDLREALNYEGRFPWKDALEIIDQLAAALEHAHLHGVVHRDIKPQNVMLDDSGLLKVLDFGIARVPTLPSLTQSGFIGSPYYVSPEQAMGEEVDTRADIYSAGIVLYELLSGTIPFDAKSPWSIISQHIATEPPPIDLPDDEIPAGVHQIVNRMVAKRPEDRFQTPTALRRAVAAVLAGQPIPDTALDTQPINPPDRTAMADSLYQRAEDAISSGEWARALDLLTQTLKFNPDHPEAPAKLAQAERETNLLLLYNTGKRAMQGNLWEEAIDNFRNILDLAPDYKDVDKLLAEAHQSLKMEDTQKFVATRYSEGINHFEAARWDKAVEAFQEVKRLSPDYERVEQLLSQAEQFRNPTFFRRLSWTFQQEQSSLWRWGLLILGILIIIVLSFFAFGRTTTVAERPDVDETLKALYEDAQRAIEAGDEARAVTLLDQILAEDPDYADAAELKRDLTSTPTPTPTLVPTVTSTPAATPTPPENPLIAKLDEAQQAVDIGEWSQAIELLTQLRITDAAFEQARVTSLFCDAYVGRGLDMLANIGSEDDQTKVVTAALADFEAGVIECPRRTDLRDQAERAKAYQTALATKAKDYETLIQVLTPVVAADPDYAGKNAKKMLYNAYLNRGTQRRESGEIVGALSDFEAALALNVDDPSEAQRQRAELLLAFSQSSGQPTPEAVETAVTPTSTSESSTSEPSTPVSKTPTPEPIRIKYGKPKLLTPDNDIIFPGKFAEVILAWNPISQLAEDEYYDLTVMHIFADKPTYWGMATKETQVQLTTDIGVGQAGGDRFYWWVTVRKANSAPSSKSLDVAVSQQSEARTFVWTQ